MKKIKFEKKLSLNKETVSKLNDAQMHNIQGGVGFLSLWNCRTKACPIVSAELTCGTCPDTASCFVTSCPQTSCAC